MKCSGENCPMQYPYDAKACAILEICPHATLIPYTNADRIRAMSDEELAKFFDDLLGWTSDGYEEHLNWLRKPAKED